MENNIVYERVTSSVVFTPIVRRIKVSGDSTESSLHVTKELFAVTKDLLEKVYVTQNFQIGHLIIPDDIVQILQTGTRAIEGVAEELEEILYIGKLNRSRRYIVAPTRNEMESVLFANTVGDYVLCILCRAKLHDEGPFTIFQYHKDIKSRIGESGH